jgi:hypothetical protein
VIIRDFETEIGVAPEAPRAGEGMAAESAPLEVQVEELRAAIRAIIREELERELRRRLPLR